MGLQAIYHEASMKWGIPQPLIRQDLQLLVEARYIRRTWLTGYSITKHGIRFLRKHRDMFSPPVLDLDSKTPADNFLTIATHIAFLAAESETKRSRSQTTDIEF